MRKLLLMIAATSFLLSACNQDEREEKKISPRNHHITKANAYNDLFMDSMSLVNYIAENAIPDSVADRMTSFYNVRNYEYAWFGSDGIAEQGMGFSSLLNFSDDTSKSLKDLHQRMNTLIGAGDIKITTNNKRVLKTELELTENLIRYTKANFKKGYVKRREIEQFIPSVREDPMQCADSLLKAMDKEKKDFSEISQAYKLLSEELRKYLAIERGQDWKDIKIDPKSLRKGKSSPEIIALKHNLAKTGDLVEVDTSALYNDNLERALKNFQQRNGFTPTGKISAQLASLLNIKPMDRVKQLLINMNRMRWIPADPDGKLLLVNTPDFTLRVLENGKEVFEMPVVVGKDGHNTTIFSDLLTTIVFSPYWNVPPSIIKSEILPAMEADPDYLALHNMEIDGEIDSLPRIRQKPGPENSLGKVKFLFPNSFNIYFHDTPAKSLFDRDVRTFSHGCIRLAQPEKLAEYLLEENKGWSADKIKAAMDAGEEKFVKLKEPVPVFITYYTAWVDDEGILQFRNDIYGHDAEVMKKMFLN